VAAFETPLGPVRIDQEVLARLADLPQVGTSKAAHAEEHSLEVQLPFLQTVLGDFSLVPLAVGQASADDVAQVIERLWGGDETLIVISSDLSHYLPYAQAQAVDRATVERILQLDSRLDHEQACGATPLAGALQVARAHGLVPRLLDLRNSGDTAGDRSRVVGYCAIAFEPGATDDETEDTARSGAKTDHAALGAALLSRARNALAEALALPTRPEPEHPALAEAGATFVTLRCKGELRGCIGRLEATRPLADDVRQNALAAAFEDPRFAPVHITEFSELEIEVSLLDAAQPWPARSEGEALRTVQPGIDGVILEWRGRHATFLPQVWEQLPDPANFMAALKRKAGLAADFWASDIRLSRYRVRKFEEVAP
jgi:AmmeMemoRadiSam system protein A